MRKGIGPNNLGAPKGVGKMYKSPAKLDTDPPKKKASIITQLDANIANRASKAYRKPAAKKGSMQEFLNRGPAPFIERGVESVKRGVKKVTGSTYGTSIK